MGRGGGCQSDQDSAHFCKYTAPSSGHQRSLQPLELRISTTHRTAPNAQHHYAWLHEFPSQTCSLTPTFMTNHVILEPKHDERCSRYERGCNKLNAVCEFGQPRGPKYGKLLERKVFDATPLSWHLTGMKVHFPPPIKSDVIEKKTRTCAILTATLTNTLQDSI